MEKTELYDDFCKELILRNESHFYLKWKTNVFTKMQFDVHYELDKSLAF